MSNSRKTKLKTLLVLGCLKKNCGGDWMGCRENTLLNN